MLKAIKRYWEQTPLIVKILVTLIIFLPLEISAGVLIYSIVESSGMSISNFYFGKEMIARVFQVILIIVSMLIIAFFSFVATKSIRDNCSDEENYEERITKPLKTKSFYWSCLKTYIVMLLVNIAVSICTYHGTATTTSNQKALSGIFNSGIHGFVWLIMESIVIAPIFEEFLFRWTFFKVIGNQFKNIENSKNVQSDEKYSKYTALGKNIAWVYSSIAFSLLHVPTNLMSFWVYFWMGLCIGYIYKKWNSVYASMFFHSAMNFIVIILMIVHI